MSEFNNQTVRTSVITIAFMFVLLFDYPLVFAADHSAAPGLTNTTFYIVHQELDDEQEQFVKMLKTGLFTQQLRLKHIDIRESHITSESIELLIRNNRESQQKSCALTVGHRPLDTLLAARSALPIFATYVSKPHLDDRVKNYQNLGAELSGIYFEQSFRRQLQLAKIIHQLAKSEPLEKVKLFVGRTTRYLIPYYQSHSEAVGLELDFDIVKRQHNASLYLEKKQGQKKPLILLNDSQVFSENELRALLLKSNQTDVLLVGSTTRHSESAAVASVLTPADTLAKQAITEFLSLCRGGTAKKADYAKDFRIKINQQLASYLKLPTLDEEAIHRSLRLQEQQNIKSLEN